MGGKGPRAAVLCFVVKVGEIGTRLLADGPAQWVPPTPTHVFLRSVLGGGATASSRQSGVGFRLKRRALWPRPGERLLIPRAKTEPTEAWVQVSGGQGSLRRTLPSDGLLQLRWGKRWDVWRDWRPDAVSHPAALTTRSALCKAATPEMPAPWTGPASLEPPLPYTGWEFAGFLYSLIQLTFTLLLLRVVHSPGTEGLTAV